MLKNAHSNLFALGVLVIAVASYAQKPGPATQGQGTQQGGTQQNQPAQGGITGGSAPIESTAFSYLALANDAELIHTKLPSGKIVVTTQPDMSTVLQWRAVVAQVGYLTTRLDDITTAADPTKVLSAGDLISDCKAAPLPTPNPAPGAKPTAPKTQEQTFGAAATPATPFIQGPADIQTLMQVAGSLASASQSVTSSSGSMTDLPLMNYVAGLVGGTVYVPSLLPPKILSANDLGNGSLKTKLDLLEGSRKKAVLVSLELGDYLQNWQTAAATTQCPAGQVAGPDVGKAQAYITKWKPDFDLLNATISAVDTFETGLFSGQNVAYAAASSPTGQGQQQAQGGNTNQQGGGQQAGQNNQNQGQGTQSAGTPTQGTQSQAPGAILQQILPADLLAQALGDDIKNVQFLEVHALESGGSQLTKSFSIIGNSFSSIHFSGGSVATFALFNADGELKCGGFAVSYVGWVTPDDVVSVIESSGKTGHTHHGIDLSKTPGGKIFSNSCK